MKYFPWANRRDCGDLFLRATERLLVSKQEYRHKLMACDGHPLPSVYSLGCPCPSGWTPRSERHTSCTLART